MSSLELIELFSINKVTFNGKRIDYKSTSLVTETAASACLGSTLIVDYIIFYAYRIYTEPKEPPLVDLLEEVQN